MVSTVARAVPADSGAYLPESAHALRLARRRRQARNEVDGWLSCHQTKIALANTCVATGEYFSKLFGSSWQDVWSESINTGDGAVQLLR